MEATAARVPRLPKPPGDGGPDGDRFREGLVGPVREVVVGAGNFGGFVGRALVSLGGVWRYSGEVLRQCGILIIGSALVVWGMTFIVGAQCAQEGNYILRSYGASGYTGAFTAWCDVREAIPYMWGWILAVKVGTGLVAEVGTMRITEELDALDSLGISPMRYVVATRLAAAILVFPFMYLVAIGLTYVGSWLIVVHQIGEISQGTWQTVHWNWTEPYDLTASFIRGTLLGVTVVLVGLYYGYRARGGPVGVGDATARSMTLNLILVHFINMLGTIAAFGLNPNAPLGG